MVICQRKEEEVVVISKIFDDDVNKGYEGLRNGILTHINGKLIKNMKDLKNVVGNHKKKFIVFKFENGKHIVLDYKKAIKVSPKILKRYGINSSYSEDLK